jgi:hypothetical protein
VKSGQGGNVHLDTNFLVVRYILLVLDAQKELSFIDFINYVHKLFVSNKMRQHFIRHQLAVEPLAHDLHIVEVLATHREDVNRIRLDV